MGAGLEERTSLKKYLDTSLALFRDFLFWFRFWNMKIPAEGYKGSIGARTEGLDQAWRSQPFSTIVLSPVLILFTEQWNPSVQLLLTWTDSFFLTLSTCHPSSSSILPYLGPPPFLPVPPHYFSSVLSVSPLHLPSKRSQRAGEASLSVRTRQYADVVFMERVLAQTDAG